MAIVASDVQSPAGDIDGAVWFPLLTSGEVTTLVTGYITDAYTKVDADEDEAAEQWVYYRAATAVADRLAGSALSETKTLVDQGSKTTTRSASQFEYWVAKAAAYLAAFNELTEEPEEDSVSGWSVLTSLRHAS